MGGWLGCADGVDCSGEVSGLPVSSGAGVGKLGDAVVDGWQVVCVPLLGVMVEFENGGGGAVVGKGTAVSDGGVSGGGVPVGCWSGGGVPVGGGLPPPPVCRPVRVREAG